MTGALYLDQQVDKHCWNLCDSYGEICVKCNCCGGFDKKTMYASRLRVVKRWLKEDKAKLSQPLYQSIIQQKNIRTDLRRFQRQITYYERKVKAVKVTA
jgi:hypothetical protein